MTKWTCTCGNINVTEICPNCNKTDIQPLSQAELNALECQNRAAVGNTMYSTVSAVSFKTSAECRKYFTSIYTFAREPLLKQIEQLEADVRQLEADVRYRDGIINDIRKDREDLTQKVAELKSKLPKPEFPKVGDMVWTVALGDVGCPERAVQRVVTEIMTNTFGADGFGVEGFNLIRKFEDKGKTWWPTKP